MSFRFTNRTVLSSLALAGASFGLLACGGGGDAGENQPLPRGIMLTLETLVTGTVDDEEKSFLVVLQATGNDSDVPEVTINGTSTSTDSFENETILLYRRDGATATIDGSFSIYAGQAVLPGPVQVGIKDKVYLNGIITFNDDNESVGTTGTYSGMFRYDICTDRENDEWTAFTNSTATVEYTVL